MSFDKNEDAKIEIIKKETGLIQNTEVVRFAITALFRSLTDLEKQEEE